MTLALSTYRGPDFACRAGKPGKLRPSLGHPLVDDGTSLAQIDARNRCLWSQKQAHILTRAPEPSSAGTLNSLRRIALASAHQRVAQCHVLLRVTLMNTNNRMNPVPIAASEPERTVWEGGPSQAINLTQYLLWGAVFVVLVVAGTFIVNSMSTASPVVIVLACVAALVPVVIVIWKWLVVANTRYELTTQRLRTRSGVFNKQMDELELYRVRDYKLEQPFFLRLLSLSSVILQTSDRSNPVLMLRAIPRGDSLREQMRTYVEEARMRRGVREVDLELP